MFIGKYSQLKKKEEKTAVVSEILRMVKDACPDDRYAFVKYQDGRWWEVENLIAREKIGSVLRDCLHSKYRSSTKSKLERRRAKKLEERQTPEEEARPSSAGIQSNYSVLLGEQKSVDKSSQSTGSSFNSSFNSLNDSMQDLDFSLC